MSIVQRAKNIIFKPTDEWNVIAAEPATIGRLFTGYAMPLALIPALMGIAAAVLFNSLLSEYVAGGTVDFGFYRLSRRPSLLGVLDLFGFASRFEGSERKSRRDDCSRHFGVSRWVGYRLHSPTIFHWPRRSDQHAVRRINCVYAPSKMRMPPLSRRHGAIYATK